MKLMDSEVIYEKKYPRKDYLEHYKRCLAEAAKDPDTEKLSFDEIMERIYGNRTYTPIPERITSSEDFIREAIDVSELYRLDIIIKRHYDHISANLSFDGGSMRYINRLFGMADQITFFPCTKERDIVIGLDFYTHTVMRNGRVVAP